VRYDKEEVSRVQWERGDDEHHDSALMGVVKTVRDMAILAATAFIASKAYRHFDSDLESAVWAEEA
jgi:hypothetical protein